MAEYVSKELTGKEQFVVNRRFDAPIDIVYEMWTDSKHFSQWTWPAGSSIEYLHCDVRPEGKVFDCMDARGRVKLYGLVHYHEMQRPNRFVYSQQFVDKDQKVSRHRIAPKWPETMPTTVTFSEELASKTRVIPVWEVYGMLTDGLKLTLNQWSLRIESY